MIPADGALVSVAVAEIVPGHDGPGRVVVRPDVVVPVPGVVDVDREDEAVVPAERTPAHVVGRIAPRDVGRSPVAGRDPEPGVGGKAPAPVVVRRPAEAI